MKRIDLHVHTTASDGTVGPAAVAELAAKSGLSAIAITDHDTVLGVREAADRAAELGVELVPGIEISTKFKAAVHILGYYIDLDAQCLHDVTDWVIRDRDERNGAVAELMAADGLPVSYAAMQRRFGPVIGRPHFAELLVEQGLAENMKDAFARYMERGQKYYLPRTILGLDRAIETVTRSGGTAVLAHPFQYRLDDQGLRELIERCMELGVTGMECRYSGYLPEQTDYLEALAAEYGLVTTGGSDFHGSHKPQIKLGLGDGAGVPYEWLQRLKDSRR